MNTITITIANDRVYDGLKTAAQRNNKTIEELAATFVESEGKRYAEIYKIGILTGAGFISRLTPEEYTAIITAAQQSPQVAELVNELIAEPFVYLDDPRLVPGLTLLAGLGLITPDRIPQLVFYERP